MLTSYCAHCFKPKSDVEATLCESCTSRRNEAQNAYAAEHPKATQSDILYAGRMALENSRASNRTDPRMGIPGRGLFPQRPAQ